MKPPFLPIIALILFSPPCLALSVTPASADCFTTSTPKAAKECRRIFLSLADQSLNATYSALVKIDSTDEPSDQRAWLKERDQTCGLAPGETNSPDWMTAILNDSTKASCVFRETLYRNQLLKLSVGQHGGKPPVFAHSEDGVTYSNYLKLNEKLDGYLIRLREQFDAWDIDKDGVISFADYAAGRIRGPAIAYWGATVEPDHPLTWKEVAERGTAYFRFLDRNHDGIVSPDEVTLATELQIVSNDLGAYEEEVGPDCKLPKPTSDAQIVLLSAYETGALASVGMHNDEVRAGVIKVAPGNRPLYVVLSTYDPVIWTFEGDVGRIQRVVLNSMETGINSSDPKDGLPMVGAVGLKASQIFFSPNVRCMTYFDEHPSRDSILRVRTIQKQLGRLPDVISASYKVAGFSLPDGAVLQPDEIGNVFGWRNPRSEVGMFYPGGVVAIDPSQVISSQKVETYDVLPGVAGLRQLVERGALVPMKGHATYRVMRKITLPAGLYGASLAKFIVPAGVPAPDGDLGHSCVVSEDGKALAGTCEN